MVPLVALIVVVPGLNASTIPALPAALLTIATDGDEEVQVMDCNGELAPFHAYPILLKPVAVRDKVPPTETGTFAGEIEIDAN